MKTNLVNSILIVFLTTFFLFTLTIPFASSLSIELKDSYYEGETFLAKISGDFIEPLQKKSILFYREHERVPFDFDMIKMNEYYYISSQLLWKAEGDYSIVLKDIKYLDFGRIVEEDIKKDFSISSDRADFSISPAFVSTNDDFHIRVQNLKDSEIKIGVSFGDLIEEEESKVGFFESLFGIGGSKENSKDEDSKRLEYREFTLKERESKNIPFEIEKTEEDILTFVTIENDNLVYQIPIFIQGVDFEERESIEVSPSEIKIHISSDSESERKISIENDGSIYLSNISIKVSDNIKPYLVLSTENITSLEENSTKEIDVEIIPNGTSGLFEGQITINSNFVYSYVYVLLNFSESYIPINGEEDYPPEGEVIFKNCAEIGGIICRRGERCSGESRITKDGVCCLEECEEIEDSPIAKIIGWLIIIGLIGFIVFFFLIRYKVIEKPTDLLKIAKERLNKSSVSKKQTKFNLNF